MGMEVTTGRDEGAVLGVAGLADALARTEDPSDDRRMIFSKGENTRHIRYEQVLKRWPILQEEWCHKVEHTRLTSIDRTPGAATFGR